MGLTEIQIAGPLPMIPHQVEIQFLSAISSVSFRSNLHHQPESHDGVENANTRPWRLGQLQDIHFN